MARRPKPELGELEAAIGHRFADQVELRLALTHVSALSSEEGRVASYQRLEFLGDRVLGLCVADMLVEAFPRAEEGELSRRLADLVRKETCAEVAEAWGLAPHVKLGGGEVMSGGRRNRAILADIVEAIIGAVFREAGYPAARAVIARAFGERMRRPTRPLRDAKTALQEWAQARKLAPPSYVTVSQSGPDHAPRFRLEARLEGLNAAAGEGASKRLAEQAAAEAFLRREGAWENGSVENGNDETGVTKEGADAAPKAAMPPGEHDV
jgi:ribonuclease-3